MDDHLFDSSRSLRKVVNIFEVAWIEPPRVNQGSQPQKGDGSTRPPSPIVRPSTERAPCGGCGLGRHEGPQCGEALRLTCGSPLRRELEARPGGGLASCCGDNGVVARTIDLNADVGEGVASDLDLLGLVTSASVACGFHAGDASTMRACCQEA